MSVQAMTSIFMMFINGLVDLIITVLCYSGQWWARCFIHGSEEGSLITAAVQMRAISSI